MTAVLFAVSASPASAQVGATRAQHQHAGAGTSRFHVPVLEYHRFIPSDLASPRVLRFDVPPSLFDAQLTALQAAGWHTITAAQLAQDLASGTRPDPKTFIITIDDGHEDGYTAALPILRAHGMVATYYVIAGRIDERHPTDPSLSSEQVLALVQAGMEIGNHTYSHVRLAALTAAEQEQEIASASARLAAITGQVPTTMAYPFGSFDGVTERAAHAAGIQLAFDSSFGAHESASGRLRSPRLHVGVEDTPAMLLARLSAFAH